MARPVAASQTLANLVEPRRVARRPAPAAQGLEVERDGAGADLEVAGVGDAVAGGENEIAVDEGYRATADFELAVIDVVRDDHADRVRGLLFHRVGGEARSVLPVKYPAALQPLLIRRLAERVLVEEDVGVCHAVEERIAGMRGGQWLAAPILGERCPTGRADEPDDDRSEAWIHWSAPGFRPKGRRYDIGVVPEVHLNARTPR
jgi:hypothetical protein